MSEVEQKVRTFRLAIDEQKENGGRNTMLMIDGGIKSSNAKLVADWGIDIAVVGSGLINSEGTIPENLTEIISSIND